MSLALEVFAAFLFFSLKPFHCASQGWHCA